MIVQILSEWETLIVAVHAHFCEASSVLKPAMRLIRPSAHDPANRARPRTATHWTLTVEFGAFGIETLEANVDDQKSRR